MGTMTRKQREVRERELLLMQVARMLTDSGCEVESIELPDTAPVVTALIVSLSPGVSV